MCKILIVYLNQYPIHRAVDDQIFFTYEGGKSALASLEMNGKEIDGIPMSVTLQNSEATSKTDLSINSLISMGHENDDKETDEHGFALCDLLTYSQRRSTRSNSILLPEKLDEQANFMDDDDDDARSVVDIIDEESSSDEDLEGDSQDIMLKRQQEMVDSDEEEEEEGNRQILVDRITPERPSLPPQRPSNPPRRPTAPPKQPLAPTKPPRPSPVVSKTNLEKKKEGFQVVPEKESVLKSQASLSEFDPLQNRPDRVKPERPARPKQPPVKPPPPRTAVKKEEVPLEQVPKEEIENTRNESVKCGEDSVRYE